MDLAFGDLPSRGPAISNLSKPAFEFNQPESGFLSPGGPEAIVTVALPFLKELDVIQSKRLELVGGGKLQGSYLEDVDPKPKPKPNPKKRTKGRGRDEVASLPLFLLMTRTPFSWWLRNSFSAKRQGSSLSTACLPLPAPHPGCFDAGNGSRLSRSGWLKLVKQRVLHIWVMVINYMYLGRFP